MKSKEQATAEATNTVEAKNYEDEFPALEDAIAKEVEEKEKKTAKEKYMTPSAMEKKMK